MYTSLTYLKPLPLTRQSTRSYNKRSTLKPSVLRVSSKESKNLLTRYKIKITSEDVIHTPLQSSEIGHLAIRRLIWKTNNPNTLDNTRRFFRDITEYQNSPILNKACQLYQEGISWGGKGQPINIVAATLAALNKEDYTKAAKLIQATIAFGFQSALASTLTPSRIATILASAITSLKSKNYIQFLPKLSCLIVLKQEALFWQKVKEMAINIKTQDNEGRTPLVCAAITGNAEVVESFLRAGADMHAKHPYLGQRTLLHWAAKEGNIEVVKILLKPGVQVNAKCTHLGKTLLHCAASEGHVEVVQALLVSGAQVHAKDQYGDTPLHEAAKKVHFETVKALLAAGSNANAKDNTGWTPLHRAAIKGHAGIVQALLANGADVHAITNDGKTALALASKNKHPKSAYFLQIAINKSRKMRTQ